MVRLKSLTDYHAIRKRLQKEGKRFTNDMLSEQEVEKLIVSNRIQYMECEAGATFVIDEGVYYRAVLCIDSEKNWELSRQDKPVMMRTRYQKDKKKNNLLKLEQQLKQNGFFYQDTTMEIRIGVEERREYYEKQYQRAQKLLERMNCRIGKANYCHHKQIQTLLQQQKVFEYFQKPYKTEEEIKDEYESGQHVCIFNADGQVIGCNSGYELNGCWYGESIAVTDEYKMCGLAPIFLYYSVCNRNAHTIKGVIRIDNTDSIRFHKKMGWTLTNKYIDCWLMN